MGTHISIYTYNIAVIIMIIIGFVDPSEAGESPIIVSQIKTQLL